MFQPYAARIALVAAIAAALLLPAQPSIAAAKKRSKADASAAFNGVPRARHADGAIVRRGDTGRLVKKVQRQLGLEADGVYGMQTARAVDAFQALARLHRSGRVDRSTWRALFRRPVGSAGSGSDADPAGGAPPTESDARGARHAIPRRRAGACCRRRSPRRCAGRRRAASATGATTPASTSRRPSARP